MNIIVDTHLFLWALGEPMKLGESQRAVLLDAGHVIHLIAVSVAEMMIKASIGKLMVEFDPAAVAVTSGFALLDFSARDALLLKGLPFHRRDPFDRMLVAQSLARDWPILISDQKFRAYGCRLA